MPSSTLERFESYECFRSRPRVRREPSIWAQLTEVAPLYVGTEERSELRESEEDVAEFGGDGAVLREGDLGWESKKSRWMLHWRTQ